jgi:hypothetical protein
MNINRFVLTIKKDSKGNPVSLQNMPIEAAEALKVFIESLAELARLEGDDTDVRLSINSGSIEASLEYPETENVIDEAIDTVTSRLAYDNDVVKTFNKIHNKISANGIEYAVIVHRHGEQHDLTGVFKAEKKFVYSRPRLDWEDDVIFIKGSLYNAGGKSSTNLHVDAGNFDYTVQCTKEQAQEVNKLYQDVYLAVHKRWQEGKNPKYVYIDHYTSQGSFIELKELYASVKSDEGLEKFERVREWLLQVLERGPEHIGDVLKIMRLYQFEFSNRGVIRTILSTLKPFRSVNEQVSVLYFQMADTLEKGRLALINNQRQ